MKTKPYTTIRGLGTGWTSFQIATRSRLYQATDHLMLVRSTGFTEDYRRVYYRDIAYVMVRETERRNLLTLVFLGLALLSLLLGHWSWIAAGINAAFWLVLLVVNVVKGTTCTCQLRTRVQTLDLPTPRRMARVPRLIGFLRDKIPASG